MDDKIIKLKEDDHRLRNNILKDIMDDEHD